MLQNLIVALIVIAAVLYVVWRYLPGPWRRRLGKVHPNLAEGPGGCGGGCGSCGGCASKPREHP